MNFTEPLSILLHLASFAFMVSLAITGFMITAGLMDKPVERSNHDDEVPTAGGIGIVAGVGSGLLAIALFYPNLGNHHLLGALAALVLVVGCVGLLDDMYETSALLRFVVMIALASVSVVIIGPPTSFPISILDLSLPYWFAFGGSVLWIFVLTNGVNFIDGANGLMGSFMCVAFLFLAAIAAMSGATNTAVFASVLAAAIAGFLPYNWRKRAHVFAGDVGALFVGFGYAIAVLLLIRETGTSGLLFVGPLLVLPILTDIFLTMLARLRRKENLMSAHSSHLYQRLIRSGKGHVAVSLMYTGSALIAGATTVFAVKSGMHRSFFFLGFSICCWALIYLAQHQKLQALSERDPQQN